MEHSSTYLLCLFHCQNEKAIARFQLQPTKQQQRQPLRQVNSETTKATTAANKQQLQLQQLNTRHSTLSLGKYIKYRSGGKKKKKMSAHSQIKILTQLS